MENNFELTQVSNNTVIGSHEAGRSNAGAVILKDFIVAMDCTMWPRTARLFREKLEDQFQLPVKYLFVTHSHGDHVMGLTAFKDITMFSSAQLQESLSRRMQNQWTPEQMEEMKGSGLAPADWIDEVEFIIPPILFHQHMEILNAQQNIEFHHSAGHADDSAWAYFPDEKVLFSGDLIFANMFPYAGDDTCDPEKWMAVLRTWLDMPIDKLVPGHGPVMGLEVVEQTLKLFEQLKKNTKDVIAKNGSSEDIKIPDTVEISDESQWMVKKTLDHWIQFYAKNNKQHV
ncbi:MAG: MBL fold metallo-hydrolase [Anaerolineaceae bacterium]|nr:MBL fold metallo-hydrolase [Anaerolineaceae bacterium]